VPAALIGLTVPGRPGCAGRGTAAAAGGAVAPGRSGQGPGDPWFCV